MFRACGGQLVNLTDVRPAIREDRPYRDRNLIQAILLYCMRSNHVFAVAASISLYCVGCGESDLRGTWSPSKDGNTYLAVVDDNGGYCGPIKVDGKVWPHKIGEAGRIQPGNHTIACGGEIGFDIRPGVIYRFNYWGP